MRNNPRSPTIQSLIKHHKLKSTKNNREVLKDSEICELNHCSDRDRKGEYITIEGIPGNLKIFIPEGKCKLEIINNFRKKWNDRIL